MWRLVIGWMFVFLRKRGVDCTRSLNHGMGLIMRFGRMIQMCVSEVYFPDRSPIQVHQSRVCKCPLLLLLGFYWNGRWGKVLQRFLPSGFSNWTLQMTSPWQQQKLKMTTSLHWQENFKMNTPPFHNLRICQMIMCQKTLLKKKTQDDTDETVNKCYSLRNQDSIQLPGRFVNRVWDKLPPGWVMY